MIIMFCLLVGQEVILKMVQLLFVEHVGNVLQGNSRMQISSGTMLLFTALKYKLLQKTVTVLLRTTTPGWDKQIARMFVLLPVNTVKILHISTLALWRSGGVHR